MDRWLRNNTVLRIAAIVLSVAIWLAVNAPGGAAANRNTAGVQEQFTKQVRVEVSPGMVVTAVSPSTANIVVNASPADVSVLPAEMMGASLVADLRGLTSGTHDVRLAAVGMPSVALRSYSISPAAVAITIAPRKEATFPVLVTLDGTVASGFGAGSPSVNIAAAQVSGAASALRSVVRVVAPVSVQGAAQTLSESVNLVAEDAAGNPVSDVQVSPATATVTIPINQHGSTATVDPQITGTPASGYVVAGESATPTVALLYPKAGATLRSGQVMPAVVDVSGWTASRTVTVALTPSAGVSRIAPASVAVKVNIERSATRTFRHVPITVQNAPAGLSVTVGVKQETVTISGPASIVADLTGSQVQVFVDASALTNADTTATVNVLLPEWLTVTQLSATIVPVQVS